MSEQYPLTNLEAVAELCKDPTREIEVQTGVRIRLLNGRLELSDDGGNRWRLLVLWPDAAVRYRLLPLPEVEVLMPVKLCKELQDSINAEWCCNQRVRDGEEYRFGLAIAQAIRDAGGAGK